MANDGYTDQEIISKLAEADMIIDELDRANGRIATLEHRNVSCNKNDNGRC